MCLQGTLVGWGSNTAYTLGIGSAPGAGIFYPPVLVAGGYTFASVMEACSGDSACAFNSSEAKAETIPCRVFNCSVRVLPHERVDYSAR